MTKGRDYPSFCCIYREYGNFVCLHVDAALSNDRSKPMLQCLPKARLRSIHNCVFHFRDAASHLSVTQEKPFSYQLILYPARSDHDEPEALFEPVVQQPAG